jgi:hypothetical protein
MERKTKINQVLRFVGVVLLVDGAIVLAMGISCLFGNRCTAIQFSERVFWAGIAAMMVGVPAVVAAFTAGQGYFGDPFTAGQMSQIATEIIQREKNESNKRYGFALRMALIGGGAIAISALIEAIVR